MSEFVPPPGDVHEGVNPYNPDSHQVHELLQDWAPLTQPPVDLRSSWEFIGAVTSGRVAREQILALDRPMHTKFQQSEHGDWGGIMQRVDKSEYGIVWRNAHCDNVASEMRFLTAVDAMFSPRQGPCEFNITHFGPRVARIAG